MSSSSTTRVAVAALASLFALAPLGACDGDDHHDHSGHTHPKPRQTPPAPQPGPMQPSPTTPGPATPSQTLPPPARGEYCVAIQGNGSAIFAHFHSLARMLELYGQFAAGAGSSSASLTMFLYESMLEHPAVKNCSGCSQKEREARLSLMLKSLVGFYQERSTEKEGVAIQSYAGLIQRLRPEAVQAALRDDSQQGREKLRELILEITKPRDDGQLATYLGELLNPRFAEIFRQSPDIRYHAEDFWASVSQGFLKIDGVKVYLRPFPVDFNGVATVIGWIGNFYAARGYDQKLFEFWFRSCGDLTKLAGKSWGEIAYEGYKPASVEDPELSSKVLPGLKRTKCGEAFNAVMKAYALKDKALKDPRVQDRIDEPVGKYFRAMPITGLLVGEGARKMEAAMEQHWRAVREPALDINWLTEFQVGFFGTAADQRAVTEEVARRRVAQPDAMKRNLKADRFTPITRAPSPYTWREVIQTSPAEPTIAEAKVMIPGQLVSIGGWVDPQPATLLKYAGCPNVAFIVGSIKAEDMHLITNLHKTIGGTALLDKLVAPKPESAYTIGIRDADAVWCTNWHKIPGLDVNAVYKMTESTYASPLEVRKPYFETRAYPFKAKVDLPSCSIPN